MKIDARITKTKNKLADALMQCVKEKPLQLLSVMDLVETAQINRSTFYLHYKSLEEFLDEIEKDLYIELEEKLVQFFDNASWLAYLINPHKKETLPIIEFILNEISSNVLLQAFIDARKYNSEFLIQLVEAGYINAKQSVSTYYPDVDQIKFRYYYSFVSMGFVGLIFSWIQNNLKESTQDISNLLHSMIYQNLSVLID